MLEPLNEKTHEEVNKTKGAQMVDYGRLVRQTNPKCEKKVGALVECWELQHDNQFRILYKFEVRNPIMRTVEMRDGVTVKHLIF